MDKIAVKYNERKNPNGYTIDGAPLRDMTLTEWGRLPEQVRLSVANAPYYEIVADRKKDNKDGG